MHAFGPSVQSQYLCSGASADASHLIVALSSSSAGHHPGFVTEASRGVGRTTSHHRREFATQVDTGLVEYHFLAEVPAMRRPQLYIYDTCLRRYGARHQWMSFTDADEFFLVRNSSISDMNQLLRQYEGFGALVVNWQVSAVCQEDTPAKHAEIESGDVKLKQNRGALEPCCVDAAHIQALHCSLQGGRAAMATLQHMQVPYRHTTMPHQQKGICSHTHTRFAQMFGSSGLTERPENGTLASYFKCFPLHHKENLHVKTIANVRHTLGTQGDPHHFRYRPGYFAVNEQWQRVDGPFTANVSISQVGHMPRAVLFHVPAAACQRYALSTVDVLDVQ